MTITIADRRGALWQWDTGRRLLVGSGVEQIHYQNRALGSSVDVDVGADGTAIIPDELLQDCHTLTAYVYVTDDTGAYTMEQQDFIVHKRAKPAGYVYTPTDQMTLQTIQRQIGDLADLTTEAKDTLVAAINEAARSGGAGSMDLRVADGYVQYSTDGGSTWQNLIAVAELKGADGSTPHIGDNGNWYLGAEDTGKPSRGAIGAPGKDGNPGAPGKDGHSPVVTATKSGKTTTISVDGAAIATVEDGADGKPGAAGADGKSAYQYAVEGGYTGTETEFSAKMAAEIPTASSPEDGEVFVIVDDSGEVVDPEPEGGRTVLYNFDFTQGLTDSVSGVNAVLAGTATQDANGVHLNDENDQLKLSFVVSPSTHIEYDLKSAELTMGGNGRLLTFATSATANSSSAGLLWRNGYGWAFYTTSGWGPTINAEEKTCMSGKTLTLSFDANLIASLYVDGVFWAKASATFCNINHEHYAFMGSASGSQSAYPVTVSAVRVYDGEYSGGVS